MHSNSASFVGGFQVWNRTLCEKDSDGDGRTNGEELGDPDCVWQEGNIFQKVGELSHPGD